MKTIKLKFFFQLFLAVFCASILFSGCAGTDVPWQLIQDDTSSGGGTTPTPGTNPPPTTNPPTSNVPGCAVNFTASLRMDTIMNDGTSKIIKGDKRPLPYPITLHFDKNKVTMLGDEFKEFDVTVTEAKRKLYLRQKPGTSVEGTLDPASGKVDLNQKDQVIFLMQVLLGGERTPNTPYVLSPFALTTDKTFSIKNKQGTVLLEGKDEGADDPKYKFEASNLDKATLKMTLVGGGFLIRDDFSLSPELKDMAILVILEGVLDKDPSSPDCASNNNGGGGSGVVVREIVKDKNGSPEEVDITNNTLDFGRVFIPDTDNAQDKINPQTNPNFTITKTLKVTSFDSDISIKAKSESGFTIKSDIQVSKGASQQFDVVFAFNPMTYSKAPDLSTPPVVAPQMSSIVIGSKTIQLTGVAKRASAELSIVGSDDVPLPVSPAALNLGIGSATVSDNKLQCDDSAKRPTLSKRIVIKNTGVRSLTVLGTQAEDEAQPVADLGCDAEAYTDGLGNVREFKVISDKVLYLGVTADGNCSGFGGFPCTLNPGNGSLNLIAAYKPANANTGKDKATAKIRYKYESNPEAAPVLIPLEAGIVPDRSNAILLQPDNSSFQIRSGGNIKVNIKTARDQVPAPGTGYALDQKINILNSSGVELKVDSMEVTGKDNGNFTILNKPTTIPKSGAMASFTVHATAPSTATKSNVYSADLTIKFTPNEAGATQGEFKVNLVALIDHVPLTGFVKLFVDRMATYIDNPPDAAVIDSIAFRNPKSSAWSSGPIYFKFDPDIDGSGKEHEYLRKVTLIPNQNFDPTIGSDSAILDRLTKMKQSEREDLVRLYTVKLTSGNQMKPEINDKHERACDEPSDNDGGLDKPYVEGECSYFYYSLANRRDPNDPSKFDPRFVGYYDDRNGEMVMNNIKLRMMNPYHGTLSSYQKTSQGSNQNKLNALFNTTVTTLPIDRLNLTNPYTGTPDEIKDMAPLIPMVDNQKIDESQLAIPNDQVQSEIVSKGFSCVLGEQWAPWLTPDDTPFGCYITKTSPYFIKGFPATPLKNGDYGIVLSLLMRFNASPINGGPASEQVPFFLSNHEFWASIQGRMVQCENNWTNCKPDKNGLSDYTK